MTHRCTWANHKDMWKYHDEEWGVPLHDDKRIFEALILDGAQAGLSWSTILNKRPHYRKVFNNFNPKKVAKYSQEKVEKLLLDSGIVRNRLKVESAVTNAQTFLAVQKEFGSFDKYIWGFVNHEPLQNKWKSVSELPANTAISDKLSKDLKKRGFKFIGSTIIYAMMQGIGMVNDHEVSCFRWKEVQ